MIRNLKINVVLVTLPILLLLMLGTVPNGYAGAPEPPQEGEAYSGPAVLGTITLTGTQASFSGQCKGQDVNVGPLPYTVALETVTPDNTENVRLGQAGPPGCHSLEGGEDLIINTVTKLQNLGSVINADVVLLFVIPR